MAGNYAFSAPCAQKIRSPHGLSTSSSTFVAKSAPIPAPLPRKRLRATYFAKQSTDSPTEQLSAENAPIDGAVKESLKTKDPPFVPNPPQLAARAAPGTLAHALQGLFSPGGASRAPLKLLSGVLDEGVTWSNPLFTVRSLRDVAGELETLLSFVEEPRFQVSGERAAGGGATELEWIFSFVYPLPWRPRVVLGGRTTAAPGPSGLLASITDEWNGSLWSVPRQAWLRLQDLMWLWASPHAEVDVGVRRVESRAAAYSVVAYPTHPEFRIRAEIEPFERYAIWSTPVLPEAAFIGGLRRLEEYDAVSPIGVRRVQDDLFEWAVPLPGALLGFDPQSFKHPETATQYIMVPGRRIAVTRFRGFATAKVFIAKRNELLEALVKDGLLTEKQTEEPLRVWSRQYDSKVGFNVNGMPTLATYGYTRLLPRVNEIAVELGEVLG